ncbi:MAG: hypothetical protein ACT4QG_14955 [Sporichthyaceae bacterium]
MTSDQRSAHAAGDVRSLPEAVADPLDASELGLLEAELLEEPLTGPEADRAISVPVDYVDELEDDDFDWEQARRSRRERARFQQRMARLRLYSYFMTLAACVFALMTFMYLVQGSGDSDATFLSLGGLFAGMTVFLLWAAVRVTHVGEAEHHH